MYFLTPHVEASGTEVCKLSMWDEWMDEWDYITYTHTYIYPVEYTNSDEYGVQMMW